MLNDNLSFLHVYVCMCKGVGVRALAQYGNHNFSHKTCVPLNCISNEERKKLKEPSTRNVAVTKAKLSLSLIWHVYQIASIILNCMTPKSRHRFGEQRRLRFMSQVRKCVASNYPFNLLLSWFWHDKFVFHETSSAGCHQTSHLE